MTILLSQARSTPRAIRSVDVLGVIAMLAAFGCSAGTGDTDAGVRRDTGGNPDSSRMDTGPSGVDVVPIGTDSAGDVNWYAARHDGQVDLPPTYCLPDGGHLTGDAGSDPYCPADRNLQGCPCTTLGMTAACWTGPRSARGRGSCMDGTTTCTGEEIPVWGPCVGEIDPDPAVTRGPATCNCFSMGTWTIANTSPCFIFTDTNYTTVSGATSSVLSGTSVSCGTPATPLRPPAPTWSTDSLRVDCGGTFHVCYRLRAFATAAAAMSHTVAPGDCVMAEPCVDAIVPPGSSATDVTLPPIPGWATSTPAQNACAQEFVNNGGYAEMVVSGTSYECQDFAQGMSTGFVFNRVDYCPAACSNPTIPVGSRPAICAMCGNGSSGSF